MTTENESISRGQTHFSIDLETLKRNKKSEHNEFVQVRLKEETKKELVAFCEREGIYVSTLVREMIEIYLEQIKR